MQEVRKREPLFIQHLDVSDPLQLVIRGQLHIEAELVDLIQDCVAIVEPEVLALDDWSYPRKLELAVALGLIRGEVTGAYKALNTLRNKIAHDLSIEIEEKHARDLYNSFCPFFCYLFGPPPQSFTAYTEILRQCVRVLWVHLNKARESQALLKEKMREDHEKVVALINSGGPVAGSS